MRSRPAPKRRVKHPKKPMRVKLSAKVKPVEITDQKLLRSIKNVPVTIMIGPGKVNLRRVAPRLVQILRVLIRHKFLGALFGKKHWPTPKEVLETFEDLGLTFLKFGQVLSMRRDLLPDAYINELKHLQDKLPAMGHEKARAMVEAGLGTPISELFSSFKDKPMAAATIAQVHEAVLKDGRHVAVKVQRPGLEAMIYKDIAALTYLVALGEKLFPRLCAFDLPVVVSEFSKTLNREIDFNHEARSIVLFRAAMADFPNLWIPGVVAKCSSKTVLTMEYSTGERVDTYGKKHPKAMPKAINTLVRLTLQSIFEEGLFHADPHSGNVFVLPDGRLCLLDFGSTGELDQPMRESLIRLLEAVVKADSRGATEAYLEMAPANEGVNRAALLVDIKAALYEINKSDLKDVSIADVFDSLVRAGSRNGVHNPPEFFLLTRTFVLLESMMSELAPRHNFMKSFREEITRLTVKHFSPTRIKEKTIKFAREFERLVDDAPNDTRRILRRIAEGNLGRVQAPALEGLGEHISRELDRLTVAIGSAGLLVGGSMLLMQGSHNLMGLIMIISGLIGMLIIGIGALRRLTKLRITHNES